MSRRQSKRPQHKRPPHPIWLAEPRLLSPHRRLLVVGVMSDAAPDVLAAWTS